MLPNISPKSSFGRPQSHILTPLTPSNSETNLYRNFIPTRPGFEPGFRPFPLSKPEIGPGVPDFNPDPSLIKLTDTNNSAIQLALYVLKISESEYRSMSVTDLERFPRSYPENHAVDILIENKKKHFSPGRKDYPIIRDHMIKPNSDELDNFMSMSYTNLSPRK